MKHYFVTPTDVEFPEDRFCAKCGEYFTNPIHLHGRDCQCKNCQGEQSNDTTDELATLRADCLKLREALELLRDAHVSWDGHPDWDNGDFLAQKTARRVLEETQR